MLTLKAQLLNMYKSNDFIQKDGTVVKGKYKLQILNIQAMKDGSNKQLLLDISIPDEKIHLYQDKIGKEVSVDVGIIAEKYTLFGI